MIKKVVQKYGGSLIVRFNKDERSKYNIVEGMEVEIVEPVSETEIRN